MLTRRCFASLGTAAVVAVSGGTLEGPKLKGTILAPSGDWMTVRPDGSSILDLRLVLRTDPVFNIL